MTPKADRDFDRELAETAARELAVCETSLRMHASWTAQHPDAAQLSRKLLDCAGELRRVHKALRAAQTRHEIRQTCNELRGLEKALRAVASALGSRGGLERSSETVAAAADALRGLFQALGVSITDTQPIDEADLPDPAG